MEEVIARNLGALFPGMEIVDHTLFRVTRDNDYDVSDEADDVRQAVEDEIRRRRFGEVVRLEISSGLDPKLRARLVSSLKIEDRQVYEIEGMVGMDDLWDVVGVPGFPELREQPFSGVTQPRLQGEDDAPVDILAAMREGDILVHHPYDAFSTSVEASSSRRPTIPTCSRSSRPSTGRAPTRRWCRSLIDAAERGKQAVCMVELKARFDEAANIAWAKQPRAGRGPRRLRDPGAEDARQVRADRPPRGRRRPPLRAHRHRQLQREDGAPLHRLRASSPPIPTSAPTSPRCSTT